jgi:hypothetical protein
MEGMSVDIDEVLTVWRDSVRALDELPEDAPERALIEIRAARLEESYSRLTSDVAPTSWDLLDTTHHTIAETKELLAQARSRIGETRGILAEADRLMETWLLAERALNRAGEDSPDRSRLLRRADAARERYQAAIDEIDPGLAS